MHPVSEHLTYKANSNRTGERNKQEYNNRIFITNNNIIFVLFYIIIKLFKKLLKETSISHTQQWID